MEKYDGYLFSKLHLIGSRSEGPRYFLQNFNYKEFVVVKQVSLWQEDPNLHKFLAKKVTITGKMSPGGILYKEITNYQPKRSRKPKDKILEIDLKLGNDVLWVNKMPPAPQAPQYMDLTLLVKWPYRSIWEGCCPTSQIYDFTIEHKDKIVWRWSEGKMFAQVLTPVYIPGGDFHEFPEVWKFNPNDIEFEGIYTARALFIASGQEVSKDFEVKFSQ